MPEISTSGTGRIQFPWADGDHEFFLDIDRLKELQDKTKVGPETLYRRICAGEWMVDDMAETLRLGLIGGGMSPLEALMLVRRYCYPPRPIMESCMPAAVVLLAALRGMENETLKKKLEEIRNPGAKAPED